MDFIKFSFLVQKTLNKQKAHLYIIGNVMLQVTEILLFLFSNFTCKKRRQQTPTFLLVRLLFRRDVTNHYCLLVCFSSIIFRDHSTGPDISLQYFQFPRSLIIQRSNVSHSLACLYWRCPGQWDIKYLQPVSVSAFYSLH